MSIEIVSIQYAECSDTEEEHLTWVRAVLPEQCFSNFNVHMEEVLGVLVKMQILILGSSVRDEILHFQQASR